VSPGTEGQYQGRNCKVQCVQPSWLFRFGLVEPQHGRKTRRRVDSRNARNTLWYVRRRGVKSALVARMNQAYVLIRNIVNIQKHTRRIRKTTRQQRVNEKNGRWKRRDFNNRAADCRKRADTQSNADSGMPADIPTDLDPTLHSLLAEPVPI
jgi:hypothetical protein